MQNGEEESSHRKDQKILYQGNIITSENELKREVENHCGRFNHTVKKILGVRSPFVKIVLESPTFVTNVLTLYKDATFKFSAFCNVVNDGTIM